MGNISKRNERKVTKANKGYLNEMAKVATSSDITGEEFADLASDATSKQLKMFLLSLARNELLRVIRLTEALDELEQTFIEQAVADKEEMNLGVLTEVIESVTKSLNRSTDLVHKVMNDEGIKLIIDNSTKIFNAPGSQSVLVLDPGSREKIRTLAEEMVKYVEEKSKDPDFPNSFSQLENKDTDIVDVDVNDESK